ncbi:MAG: S8 family serine peptidase, partial [Bacteroidota bacterium]
MVATDSSDLLEAWIKQNHPDWKYSEPSPGIFKILANGADVPALSIKAPGIRSIDKGDRKAQPEAVPGDFSNSLNTINAAHAAFPEINGTFSKLSVKEKPFNVLDIDLRGRIDLTGPFDEPYTDHATYMATIAAGGGNQSLFTKGGGWKSTITTADYDRLLPDLDLQSKGITVQNHSYGVGIETYYGIESAEYDKQVYENQSLVHIFSSGNKGNQSNPDGLYKGLAGFANITGQFKASKNTISVGSAEQDGTPAVLSSAGPVDDGRIKPELIAIGDAGSSEAAAVVSGIALLVQDAWKKKFGDIPDAAMVKAILINSANDTGTKGPDHKSGYGIANALGALNIINNGTHGSSTIFQNEEKKIFITVPTEIHRLTVTLV